MVQNWKPLYINLVVRKVRKLYSIVVLFFSIFLIAPLFLINTKVDAAEIRMEDEESVVIDEMIDDDLYVSAGTVVINDDVSGDLIAFGGQITINDDIYGNAFIFGGVVTINGDIRGSLFCGAGQVTVEGNVEEDVNVGAGMVTLNGNVDDDVRIGAGIVSIKSEEIGGDLLVGAGNGSVSSDTEVAGDQKVEIGPETDTRGSRFPTSIFQVGQRSIAGMLLSLLRKLALLAGWLIIGILLFKFVPVKSRKVTDLLTEKSTSVKSLIIGLAFLLVLFLVTPVVLLLAFIGIGQPALIVMLALLGLVFSIAGIYSATGITRMIMRKRNPKYDKYVLPMILGVTVYQILGWIPCCIGLTIKLLVTLWGVGGILLLKWNMISPSKKK